jgi:hypothetical protein
MRKMAIVISGAVSLGSYEAGVMYEVLEAIALHNEVLKVISLRKELLQQGDIEDLDGIKEFLKKWDLERIEVDVIAGASAGGMTACLLAQHLLCQAKSLRTPYQNPLYSAWVEDVDIRQLLQVSYDNHKYSLLQSGVVQKIGEKYLVSDPEIEAEQHPVAGQMIHLGIAMSNLNGFLYDLTNSAEQGTQSFSYSHYKDQFICKIERTSEKVTFSELSKLESSSDNSEVEWQPIVNPTLDDPKSAWDFIRQVGLSSGAFPLAFRPVSLKRCAGLGRVSKREGSFIYTDGGVFENEPIGMAKALVSSLDRSSSPDKRLYLYVAPGTRKASQNTLQADDADIPNTVSALVQAIFEQARFQDWVLKEMKDPIYFITANNDELIGEVFSAFAGFLEKKFRAYDYNIGREKAREKLLEMHNEGVIYYNSQQPEIEWHVTGSNGKPSYEGNWKKAKEGLRSFAVAGNPQSKQSERARALGILRREYKNVAALNEEVSQSVALSLLMKEVDLSTRREILQQILDRLDSLLILADQKIDNVDKQNSFWGFFVARTRKVFQSIVIRPLLRGAVSLWLRINILDVPSPPFKKRFQDYILFLKRLWT